MYDEQELMYLYHLGSQQAYDLLFRIYKHKFETFCKKYYFYTSEISLEDYVQIALLSFYRTLDSYRFDMNTKVQTYFMYVLSTSLKGALRYSHNKKHIPYDRLISLNEDGFEYGIYEDVLDDKNSTYKPDVQVLLKEEMEEYQYAVYQKASLLERKVFDYFVCGYSFHEIAELLDVSIKTVYNANYRLQKKIAELK